jgi:hypothetical protein
MDFLSCLFFVPTFTEFTTVNCNFFSADLRLLSTSVKIAIFLIVMELKKKSAGPGPLLQLIQQDNPQHSA